MSQSYTPEEALWECLLFSGADVSDFAYETVTAEGRADGLREFCRRGSTVEVVDAVRKLRQDYDLACRELEGWRDS